MEDRGAELEQLEQEFEACRRALLALGDENRQHILIEMMRLKSCSGVRVGAIAQQTHLSRPAVSHHLRILRDAGILNVRREGTRNYYYFDEKTAVMAQLLRWAAHAKALMSQLPDRSGEKD